MSEIVYSHRPAAGVSVAATNSNGRLIVAFSLVNDGTSRSGIIWSKRRDAFSRPTARQILKGRLERASTIDGNVPLTVVFPTNLSARQFMAEFRRVFKPTPDESDITFSSIDTFGGTEIRYRQSAKQILESIFNMANEVVADAGSRI